MTDSGWVVMVQKVNRDGGYQAPEILGQRIYTDREEAQKVQDGVPSMGGLAGAHAYMLPVTIR